jgi:hypothetical protein
MDVIIFADLIVFIDLTGFSENIMVENIKKLKNTKTCYSHLKNSKKFRNAPFHFIET